MSLLSRRLFLGALAASAIPVRAEAAPTLLRIAPRDIEVNGRLASVFGILGTDGKPGLALGPGDRFSAQVENGAGADQVLHWHGQTPPVAQDGVAMGTQRGIPAGGSQSYLFEDPRSGTHWMHSHLGFGEQRLMAAPLIVRTKEDLAADERDHTVMLHDFTFRDPAEILAELQKGGGEHANHSMAGMDHSKMTMGPAMLNDVAYDAYLANDRTLADPEIVTAEPGGRVRLRVINAASASNMWIDLGSLSGELIAVDGNPVIPVTGSRFPLAIAQRADIRFALPKGPGAYPVLFAPEGVAKRTGIVIAVGQAKIEKLADMGDIAPAVGLELEMALRAARPLAAEPASQVEMLMLTGGDAGYNWGFNGKPFMHETLFTVKAGTRVQVMLHNMTSMAHPMHLHGHHFQIVGIGSKRIEGAARDTVLVPPGTVVTIGFDAANPGTWAFHCHHLYHQNAGMMGTVAYTNAA
jgi:FtsP/CotA-like multicopper oxidase with cupredoxin domain